jgi:predicted GNAT family acetyltransferase
MSWRRAARRDLPSVLSFLLRDETLCVPFTSRLRTGARGCDVFCSTDAEGNVEECILYTSAGLLLPVLLRGRGSRTELAAMLRALRQPMHSIMGPGRCVDEAQGLVPLAPNARIDYFLMSLARPQLRATLPADTPHVRVRRADPADAEALLPLQRGYELEEVIIDPERWSEAQCMKLLRQALVDELVFVVELDGLAVAKAATNARGFGVDQIGGVYTVPAHRGQGFGKLAVAALLKDVFAEKAAACLFVKKRNRSAIALYDRLGFRPVTDYAITYYGL